MDIRLLTDVCAAVARAAVDSGVARLPYPAHYPLKSIDDIKIVG
jgi:malate dehydrogenase (oxaloacetate-decarboxylating)(NADP+)